MRKDKNVFTFINHRISTDFAPTSIQTEVEDDKTGRVCDNDDGNDGDDDDDGVWINYNILATAPSPLPKQCGISIVALSDQYCLQRSTKFQKNIISDRFFIDFCCF